MFCPNCGTKLEDGVKFCPNCGNQISQNDSTSQAANNVEPAKEAETVENTTVENASVENPTVENPTNAGDTNTVQNNGYQNPNGGYQFAGYQNPNGGYQNPNGGYQNPNGGYQNNGYQNGNLGYNTGNGNVNANNLLKDKRIWAAGGILIAVFIMVLCLAFRPKTVKLDKYVKITTEGYNSVGTAKAQFDTTAFMHDYRGKIKLNKKAFEEDSSALSKLSLTVLSGEASDYEVANAFAFLVSNSGKLDKSRDLKNGDTVRYDWDKLDTEKLERYFKVKVKAKGVSTTVSGLEDVKTKDIFKGVEVKFSGRNGSGYGRVTGSQYSYYMTIVDGSNLKNGDKVTVEIKKDRISDFIKVYGFAPAKSTKTFKVSGLTEYLSELSKLNDKQIEFAKKQTEDYITASFAKSANLVTGSDPKYVGMYLLNRKNSSYGANELYVVYSYTVSSVDGRFDPVTLYMPVRYINVTVGEDTLKLLTASIEGRTTVGGTVILHGFTDGNEMYKNIVTAHMDNYDHDVLGSDLEAFGK